MTEPIRVLQVVTHMNRGGLETMLMNYYRHMDRSRVQFDFLVHRENRGDYDDEIESLGGQIHRLPRLVPWSGSYKKALDSFFEAHPQYKIVHVHQDCLSSVILKAAKKRDIPVRIAHSHNTSQDKDLKYPIKLFYKQFIPKYATKMFACGQKAGDWMFSGAPFEVLNNAIDTAACRYDSQTARSVRQTLGIRETDFVAGHVGRFCPQKNHTFLLDIFSQMAVKNPNARLLLVGDGSLRQSMEEKAATLGIADKVIFTGVRADVPVLLQAMDVFIFPSLYEGLPVTLVEAQAAGLSCLISDGVPDDCILTDLIHRHALTAPASSWAISALDLQKEPRSCRTGEAIAAAGYDIVRNAQWLEQFYLSQWKVNE